MAQFLLVAAAAVFNSKGQVLIAKRQEHVDFAGLWELPGGKLAPYETGFQALKREIHEELDIDVIKARPLIKIRHDYVDKKLILDVWKVLEYKGEPWGKEGQVVRWVNLADLIDYSFPDANKSVIAAVSLPETYITLEVDSEDVSLCLNKLSQVKNEAKQLVQLNLPDWPQDKSILFLQKVLAASLNMGIRLIVNTPINALKYVDAAGLHLTAVDLAAYQHRPIPIDKWLIVSCNNLNEISLAEKLGADSIILNLDQLGGGKFSNLTSASTLPVYAALDSLASCSRERIFGLGGQGPALSYKC